MKHSNQNIANVSNVETNDGKIEVDLAQYAKKTMSDKDYTLFEMLMGASQEQIKMLLGELDRDGRQSMAALRKCLRGMLNEGAFRKGAVR